MVVLRLHCVGLGRSTPLNYITTSHEFVTVGAVVDTTPFVTGICEVICGSCTFPHKNVGYTFLESCDVDRHPEDRVLDRCL